MKRLRQGAISLTDSVSDGTIVVGVTGRAARVGAVGHPPYAGQRLVLMPRQDAAHNRSDIAGQWQPLPKAT